VAARARPGCHGQAPAAMRRVPESVSSFNVLCAESRRALVNRVRSGNASAGVTVQPASTSYANAGCQSAARSTVLNEQATGELERIGGDASPTIPDVIGKRPSSEWTGRSS